MPALGLQTYIWNNNIRSIVLLIGFPILLLGMVFCLTLGMIWAGMLPPGEAYGGDVAEALSLMWSAAPLAIGVAVVWFVIAYFFNQAIIDFATGSRPLTREEEPRAYNLLENLCISRGMTMPTLRIIETDEMNAFASGLHEGKFSVTVTRGILRAMDDAELEAVLGHELTHIINRDVRTMVIASIFAGIITLMCQIIYRSIMWGSFGGLRGRRGNVGVFILVAMVVGAIGYVLALVIRMAISRSREYVADAGSVQLTKNPDAMISALRKISGHAHLDAPASMRAMFLEDDDEGVMGLFATHPPVEKRVQALMAYGGGHDVEPAAARPPPPPEPTAEPARWSGEQGRGQGPWGQRRDAPPGPWG
ncbi:MAG TPA: M48 family metallopeptidase [Caulobacteraceae bacterium]|nr:M48 family metallopeptidase [Caulobacteraceae bacterium]